MRTTIDLPDALYQRAKLAALQRRQTLKGLLTEVLQSALPPESPGNARMTTPPISLGLAKPVPPVSNREAAALLEKEDQSKFTTR